MLPFDPGRVESEVQAHNESALGRLVHLNETRLSESVPSTDMPALDEVGIALDRSSAACSGEVDGCRGQSMTDAVTVSGARQEAGHCPHRAVGLVLVATVPWHAVVPQHAQMNRSRGDGAPADRLAAPKGNQTGGRSCLRLATGCTQHA